MTNNHKKTGILVITACLFSIASLSVDAGVDSLWLKTVELAERNRGWIAGETKILIEFLNSQNTVTKSITMMSTAELTENNVVKREITGSEEFQMMKNQQSGVPLRLQVTLVTMPDNLQSLKIDMVFSSTDDLYIYPETSIMEMTAVRYLIFKQRIRWTIRYDNYFRMPEHK